MYMLLHAHQRVHTTVSVNNFRIIKKSFKNHKMKRKVSEACLIKKYKPTLNIQKASVFLIVFDYQRCIHKV